MGHPLMVEIGWQGSGPDYEVYRRTRFFEWFAYDEELLIGRGTAWTSLGLAVAIRRHKRNWRKAEAAGRADGSEPR